MRILDHHRTPFPLGRHIRNKAGLAKQVGRDGREMCWGCNNSWTRRGLMRCVLQFDFGRRLGYMSSWFLSQRRRRRRRDGRW